MELVLFVGLQASGKSTFYAERFARTHLRLSMDMLKTRHRERLLFDACLEAKALTVIDNTNPSIEERARYVQPARVKGFRIVGYYFQSAVEACKRRNEERGRAHAVPLAGLLGTAKRLVLPTMAEGFDELHYVRIDEAGRFVVEGWRDEV